MLQAGQRAAATEQLSLAAKVSGAPSFAAHETFRAFDLLTYKLLDAGERESVSAALDQMAANADGIDRFATYGRDAADIRSGRMPRSYQVFHEVLSMNERMWARVARARRTSRVSPR